MIVVIYGECKNTTFVANNNNMDYLYIKALHVIFVICWFAGLFYMVRLFIYTKESNEKEEPAKTPIKPPTAFDMFDKVNGTDATRKALQAGTPASEIVKSWKAGEDEFRKKRKKYLLYGDDQKS